MLREIDIQREREMSQNDMSRFPIENKDEEGTG
jgi:hypothetical protein